MTGTPGSTTEHLTPLGGGRWTLWRDAALRGAGFPAGMFTRICDDRLADAADQLADGVPGTRERYARVYAGATERLRASIRSIAGDRAFREALTWQNPDLVRNFLDRTAAGEPRDKSGRKHELALASYLQRYCLKNDTIGFFGPVGWARIDPDGAALSVSAGGTLVARRTTYFEGWAIEAVAGALAARPEVWPWLRPRPVPSASVAGRVVRLPFQRPVTLSVHESHVLHRCDGRRTVRDITGDPPDPQAMATLRRLHSAGVLRIDLTDRHACRPERRLVERIEAIAEAGVRAGAHAPVADLLRARDRVSAAAGDPGRLLAASAALGETFEAITGLAATRLPGSTYVGRTLVYEDAVRATGVRLGRHATDALAAPLGLLLDSASWLANTIAERYRARAGQLLDRECARTGDRAVPLLRLFTAVLSEMAAPGSGSVACEPVDTVVGELQRRWRTVLGLTPDTATRIRHHHVSAGDVAEKAARAFRTGAPLFRCARWHSPDLMVIPEQGGDLRFVLGELHCASNTLEGLIFAAQHPAPQRLRAAAAESGLAGRVIAIPRADSHQASTRMSRSPECMLPSYVYLCLGDESQEPPPGATTHPVLDLLVRRRGDDLVVAHRAGGPEYDFLEVIGEPLSVLCAAAFRPFGGTGHCPRISIDRLVVARESWTFPAATVPWVLLTDEPRRYAQARHWRRAHGVAERGFVRVPVERKPMAVDFRSLPMVNLLARSIRRTAAAAGTVTITEMLPDLDQLWLRDAAGGPYTAELRLVAVDRSAGPPPAGAPAPGSGDATPP